MGAFDETRVIAWSLDAPAYPSDAPFSPSARYPEYRFGQVAHQENKVYDAVRQCFRLAGLDASNYGTASWKPLGRLIRPGETVLLKPNLVKEVHPRDPAGWTYVMTHGSVIRAVADFVWQALEGQGTVVLADAPHTDSSFDRIVPLLGLDAIQDFYRSRGLSFELVDLRKEEWVTRDAVIVRRRRRPGDPAGYVAFDLREASELDRHAGAGRYVGADYDTGEVNYHHTGGRHEYLIAGSAIKCDVIFSLPKMKTHKKAGITISLKNLVGINGDKNWLPHHTEGDRSVGGDEHPDPRLKHRTERRLVSVAYRLSRGLPLVGPVIHRLGRRLGRRVFGDTEEVVRSGNWWGNDTTWRMCLDLNKIALFGAADGSLRLPGPGQRKRHFVLVDGVIAGEGRGPMNPDPVPAGLLVFGTHPASVDAACAVLMGFQPDRIPIVRQAFRCHHYPLAEWEWGDVALISNRVEWNARLPDVPASSTLHFRPHFGWTGQIERPSPAVGAPVAPHPVAR